MRLLLIPFIFLLSFATLQAQKIKYHFAKWGNIKSNNGDWARAGDNPILEKGYVEISKSQIIFKFGKTIKKYIIIKKTTPHLHEDKYVVTQNGKKFTISVGGVTGDSNIVSEYVIICDGEWLTDGFIRMESE